MTLSSRKPSDAVKPQDDEDEVEITDAPTLDDYEPFTDDGDPGPTDRRRDPLRQ